MLLPDELAVKDIPGVFRYEEWRRREVLLRAARITTFVNLEWFRNELVATRVVWGRFPMIKMYGCDGRLDSSELFLPAGFNAIDLHLIYEIRFILDS